MLLSCGDTFIDLSLIESFKVDYGADTDTIKAKLLSGSEHTLMEVNPEYSIRIITLLNNIKQDEGMVTREVLLDTLLEAEKQEENPAISPMEKYTKHNLYQDPNGSIYLVIGSCEKDGVVYAGTADADTFEDAQACLDFYEEYIRNQGDRLRLTDAVRLSAHHELCFWISGRGKNSEIKLPSGEVVKFKYYQAKVTEDKTT